MSIGTRSHHALKIAIEPCIRPTFECSTAPIMRLEALAEAVRDRDRRFSCRQSSICGRSLPR
jgi:hypothetical protein